MKVSGIWQSGGSVVIKVSCGKCKQPLAGEENYCPKCGGKLRRLPKEIDTSKLVDLMNWGFDSGALDPKGGKKKGDKKGGGDEVDNVPANESPGPWSCATVSECKCPYGHGDPDTCGMCRPADGACEAAVLASIPPKYNICPYRGGGYVFCSEASASKEGLQ